jgi:hypothetical protein
LYAFYLRRKGPLFCAGALGLHLLYFLYSGLTYVYVWCDCRLWGGERTLTLSQRIKPLGSASSARRTESSL